MDCEKSIELLSDFHDNLLGGEVEQEVRAHLTICLPCAALYHDIDAIVIMAARLRVDQQILFPDETVVWQRLSLTGRATH